MCRSAHSAHRTLRACGLGGRPEGLPQRPNGRAHSASAPRNQAGFQQRFKLHGAAAGQPDKGSATQQPVPTGVNPHTKWRDAAFMPRPCLPPPAASASADPCQPT